MGYVATKFERSMIDDILTAYRSTKSRAMARTSIVPLVLFPPPPLALNFFYSSIVLLFLQQLPKFFPHLVSTV